MSRSLNKLQLIGNAGSAPEIRTTSGGVRVARLSLATNRTWTDREGQEHEETSWHRLVFFGRLVDVVEAYVSKGDRLYVEGSVHYSTSAQDGQKSYWTDVRVRELIMLGGRSPAAKDVPQAEAEGVASAEDLPF